MSKPEWIALAVITGILLSYMLLLEILNRRLDKKHKEHENFIQALRASTDTVTIKLTRKQAAQVYLKLYDPDSLADTGVCETLLQIQSFLGGYHNDQ